MTEFPETRSTLLIQVRSPDNREAWEEFVLIYRPLIYRMARRRGMQDADAQDLAQSVLVRIAGAIDRWEKSETAPKFRHWLRKVAKNAILTTLSRSPKDAAGGGSVVHELLAEVPDIKTGPDAAEIETEAMRECFLRAAANVRSDVNAETWQTFELTTLKGLSCEEAALVVGKSVGAVYAIRSRVMRRLREQIELLGSIEENLS